MVLKGVILAGGTGSRLSPLTKVTNKHLLPVYDEPMIYKVIKTLTNSVIKDITIDTRSYSPNDHKTRFRVSRHDTSGGNTD